MRLPKNRRTPALEKRVRDVSFFVKALQHAVDMMARKSIQVTTHCDKQDEYFEYVVHIPVGGDGCPVKQSTISPLEPTKEYATGA